MNAIAFLFLVGTVAANFQHPLSDGFINRINKKQSTWKAGRNFPINTPLSQIKRLMGAVKRDFFSTLPIKVHDDDLIASLPENFDPRDKWPNCPSLNDIRDQGDCGSCWAFGAVEAMTDRVCTFSNGTKQFYFSAEDLLSCCTECGEPGCDGGVPERAWNFWSVEGIVSGGGYQSNQGCRPYEIAPQKLSMSDNRKSYTRTLKPTPASVNMCQSNYNVSYSKDKHYGKNIVLLYGEDHIKAELFKNGPVETMFTVYQDLIHYKSGVYVHTTGKAIGEHAVKMIGWGVENGKKYWRIANSWDTNWGDHGFFKILRGENHCGIESSITAGEPILDNL